MVKQFKCWKRIRNRGLWKNTKNSDTIHIVQVELRNERGNKLIKRDYAVNKNKFTPLKEKIKDRPSAIKFANQYMRKHDKC